MPFFRPQTHGVAVTRRHISIYRETKVGSKIMAEQAKALPAHPVTSTAPKVYTAGCLITESPTGEGLARVTIPAEVMKRMKTRSNGVEMGQYLWENVLRQALYGHVY
jgi:hypothetical protein